VSGGIGSAVFVWDWGRKRLARRLETSDKMDFVRGVTSANGCLYLAGGRGEGPGGAPARGALLVCALGSFERLASLELPAPARPPPAPDSFSP